ncbi:hypothetical protein [Burkholderia pyrrocinia]|uniref:hypothetical protein n=1 Tax=Burkholderia pyrrocinia TaxID=60550 RepID=UPI001BCE1B0F|nr:hypothetical protein [Burkholderia pyrrocinia]QVN23933.1 hypothetical protein JYG32_36405 [Burkholderia pyrrocinia]
MRRSTPRRTRPGQPDSGGTCRLLIQPGASFNRRSTPLAIGPLDDPGAANDVGQPAFAGIRARAAVPVGDAHRNRQRFRANGWCVDPLGRRRLDLSGTGPVGWSNDVPVVTPYPDCVLVMPSLRQLRPGVTVVRLSRLVDKSGPPA